MRICGALRTLCSVSYNTQFFSPLSLSLSLSLSLFSNWHRNFEGTSIKTILGVSFVTGHSTLWLWHRKHCPKAAGSQNFHSYTVLDFNRGAMLQVGLHPHLGILAYGSPSQGWVDVSAVDGVAGGTFFLGVLPVSLRASLSFRFRCSLQYVVDDYSK